MGRNGNRHPTPLRRPARTRSHLARVLPRAGADALHDPLQAAGYQIERFRAFVPVLGISAQRRRQLISVGGNLMSFDLISQLRRERDISIVHSHALGRIGGIALTVAKQRGVPFVVTIHGGVLDLPPQIKNDFNRPIGGWEWGKVFGLIFQSHRLFPEADAIITCNASEARLLQEKYPDRRIVVQPHGVPLDIYQHDHREDALVAFPQIRGKQILLCVGRIDPIKNQGWLVDEAPEIFRKHPRAVLVLAGAATDEAYGENIQRKIDSYGLRDRVLVTGGLPPNDPRLIGLFQEAEALIVALALGNVRAGHSGSVGHRHHRPVQPHFRRLHPGSRRPERLAV